MLFHFIVAWHLASISLCCHVCYLLLHAALLCTCLLPLTLQLISLSGHPTSQAWVALKQRRGGIVKPVKAAVLPQRR